MSTGLLTVVGILATPLLAGAATHFGGASSHLPNSAAVRDTTGCLDTLHTTDSVNAIVKITVKPQDSKTKLPADFEGLFAQEFRTRVKVPSKLPLSVVQGWASCDTIAQKCASGALIFGSQIYATAQRNGTLTRIGVVDVSLTPALADSIGAALRKMSEDKIVPFFEKPDSIPLDISIEAEQSPDSVPAFRHLFHAEFPRFNTELRYAQYPRNAGGPKYPRVAEARSIGDTVQMTFTVLPDGTIEPQTVDILKGHYREFVRAVLEKLATTRYVPGRIGNCAVATRNKQKFVFRTR